MNVGSIFGLVVAGLIYYYVVQLEQTKCECSKNWRRDYIKYYNFIMMIYILINLFGGGGSTSKTKSSSIGKLLSNTSVLSVILFLSIVEIYALFTYIRDLRRNDCICATETQNDIYIFLKYYSILRILGVIFAFLMIINFYLNMTNKK
jgi:hypothetical protein